MIDHLMTFASEAEAKADPVVGQYFTTVDTWSGWRGDCCIPGVFAWSPADNTEVNGEVVRQPYDTNWRILISEPEANSELMASGFCHLVTDREAAVDGQPFILQTILTDAELNSIALEPTFLGSAYPYSTEAPEIPLDIEVGLPGGPMQATGGPSFSSGVSWRIESA